MIYLCVNLIFNCIIHQMVCTLGSILILYGFFNVLGQRGTCHFTSLNFHVIPDQFPCLPGGMSAPWSYATNILKTLHFPQ